SGGIYGGADWEIALANAMQQAAAVVLLVTPDSVQSGWVHGEIERALELDKPIIPLIVRELTTEADQEAYAQFGLGRERQFVSMKKFDNDDRTFDHVANSLVSLNVARNQQ
ncbi:MAG: toll/interleukin-1 receptor domain-containing protein, partial [Chloroflexota bacterium]